MEVENIASVENENSPDSSVKFSIFYYQSTRNFIFILEDLLKEFESSCPEISQVLSFISQFKDKIDWVARQQHIFNQFFNQEKFFQTLKEKSNSKDSLHPSPNSKPKGQLRPKDSPLELPREQLP